MRILFDIHLINCTVSRVECRYLAAVAKTSVRMNPIRLMKKNAEIRKKFMNSVDAEQLEMLYYT